MKMLRSATALLWALLFLNLYGSLVATEPLQNPPNQLKGYKDTVMAPVTQANDIMVKLDMLESQLKRIDLLDDQLKSLQEIVDRHEFKLKYPDFKQIGSRYFYIENTSTQYWPTAASTCHEMGGYLAGIKDLDELEAISHYLMKNTWYWIGIRNVNIGEFKYSATGKQARFLKWGYGYPENYDSYNCVYLYNGLMYNYSCDSSNRFICQVDKDI